MSPTIKILPEILANKIAAGEVVERPASVVKELVENSIDSGAGRIFVDISQGGTKLIRIADDGCGMGQDDALLAFERHATSKISTDDDLFDITTLGFRGEALPSIASVSRLRLVSSTGDGPGAVVAIEGGKLVFSKEEGAAKGTIIEVRDLFFNTPARLKFLKSRDTEFGHIASVIEKIALSHPEIYVRLTHDGREALLCTPVKDGKDRVAQVFGAGFADQLARVEFSRDGQSVTGFVSRQGESFSDKSRQEFFVNGRPVKSPVLSRALYDACQSAVMKQRHPACILFVNMPPAEVDVNVHPAKREVRFRSGPDIHRLVYDAVNAALRGEPGAAAEEDEPRPEGEYAGRVREAVKGYMESPAKSDHYAPPFNRSEQSYGRSAPRYDTRTFGPQHPDEPTQQTMRLPRSAPLPADSPTTDPNEHHPHGPLVQIADSYIMVSEGDSLLIIDQHAAHERIQYERVKARSGGLSGSQGLLIPERIELSGKDASILTGIISELAEIGLDVEHFGGGSFIIRSKPLFLDKLDAREVVVGILADLDEKDIKGSIEDLREKIYQLMACKSAVKAGIRLHPEAMARLVQQLFACGMPYTCAHGRPTVVRFGVDELEKMFKRK